MRDFAPGAPHAHPVSWALSLDLTLRACRETDLEALEWYGMFTHHRSLFAEAWQQQLAGCNDMFVVDLAGFPVAQTWVDQRKRKEQSAGVLWAVRVFPFLSGQGIGSWMLLQLEEILRRRGLRWLEVGVEKNNPRARKLYERLRYQYVADVCETYTYTPPMGVPVHAVADQWLLRKRLL